MSEALLRLADGMSGIHLTSPLVSPFDIKLVGWKAGLMKTTIDLPEDLVREMKCRAVREGRKLREVAEEVFRRGLAAPSPARGPGIRHRVSLPIIPAPTGAKPFDLSGHRLLALEMEADLPT